ncbi:MAG: HDIG domain-containing protein [Verrucomicrobiae bacterium]|nr:HDIG domain-containing protein [Verrucomicrobiae bacterium]
MFRQNDKPRVRRTLEGRWLRDFLGRSSVVRWIIVLVTLSGLIGLALTGSRVDTPDLTIGQISPRKIVVRVNFSYPDQVATDSARNQLLAKSPNVYGVNLTTFKRQLEQIRHLFDGMQGLKAYGKGKGMDRAAQRLTDAWNKDADLPLSVAEVQSLLVIKDRKALFDALSSLGLEIAENGIMGEDQFSSSETVIACNLNPADFSQLRKVKVGQIPTARQVLPKLMDELNAQCGIPRASARTVERLVSCLLVPNLQMDSSLSGKYRQHQLKSVETIFQTAARGDVLIEQGERVTQAMVAILKAHDAEVKRHFSGEWYFRERLGTAALIIILVGVTVLILVFQQTGRRRAASNLEFSLLATIILLHLGLCNAVTHLIQASSFFSPSLASAAIPSCFGPMLVAVLIHRRRAHLITFVSSFLLGIITRFDFAVMLTSLISSVVGIHFLSPLRRRARIYEAGLLAGLTAALVNGVYGFMGDIPVVTMGFQCLAAVAAAFVSSLLISALLPLFEAIFKVTTDLRWLEMSDLNHPLLRRMVLEAPGTYHHSLIVATLVERACEAIGANPLQGRVCSYFHDVGKLKNPEYFCENQAEGRNPHDDMAPNMSALIIIAHVKDGVDFSIQHHLVRPVIETIQQHHGTSQVAYFYKLAKRHEEDAKLGSQILQMKVDDVPKVEEEMYRYPGPKASSPEICIISLADAVEGASRSMQKPTPQRIESLVEGIIADRLRDGQLDECPLTMPELKAVTESFITTLLNMHHTRISYPKDEDSNSQPAPPAADEAS